MPLNCNFKRSRKVQRLLTLFLRVYSHHTLISHDKSLKVERMTSSCRIMSSHHVSHFRALNFSGHYIMKVLNKTQMSHAQNGHQKTSSPPTSEADSHASLSLILLEVSSC